MRLIGRRIIKVKRAIRLGFKSKWRDVWRVQVRRAVRGVSV